MNNLKTIKMVQVSILSSIIILLALTPLGFIPIGPIRATTIHIPVIIGGILMGPKIGGILGGIFGLTSFIMNIVSPTITSFVFTPFYSFNEDFSGNFWSIVICFLPRILIGVVSGYSFIFLSKIVKSKTLNCCVCGIIGSLTNTILVMFGIFIFFGNQYALAKGNSVDSVFNLIAGIVGTIGIPEAIVSGILCALLGASLLKILNNNNKD